MEPEYRYRATVKRVVDGDTVDLIVDVGFRATIQERFRLAGIDAYEMKGEEREKGQKAKIFLRDLIEGREVLIISGKEKGKYGRWVCIIFTVTGLNINDLLVEDGHAIRRNY
jgi:micrococcal nuclease